MFKMQEVIGASIESTCKTLIASGYYGAEFEAACLWMWICIICHPKYCCYTFELSISIMPLSITKFHIN